MTQTTDWKPTACILCECNYRHARCSSAASTVASSCAPATGLDGHLRRRSTGTRRHPRGRRRASRRCATATAATRFSITAAEGGQGNHLPGAYATATRRALGSRYRSSALAQEKTGEFWVSDRMLGTATRADFEHCDVALFLGKNPWHSHSIPRARDAEGALERSRAHAHRDRPAPHRDGGDGGHPPAGAPGHRRVAALGDPRRAGRGGAGRPRLRRRARSPRSIDVEPVLRAVDVARCCASAGVDEGLVRKAARAIGNARALASFEDLGVQMNRDSTLVSYLHRLLIALTGNFGKKGTHFIPTTLVDLGNGRRDAHEPGGRRAHRRGPRSVQRHRRRDPHRSPEALPRDDRRGRQPGALAGRLGEVQGSTGGARHAGGHRRGDERDGAAGALRVAGGDAVREGRGDVLQLRVPAQRLSLAATALRATGRNIDRGRDPRAAVRGAGRGHRGRPRAAARGGGSRGAPPTRRAVHGRA